MEKETINKEVSDALHMLLHCALKDKDFSTQKAQFHIVYDYIKSLEKLKQKAEKKMEELERDFNYYCNKDSFDYDDGEFDGDRADDLSLQLSVLREIFKEELKNEE